MKTLKVIGNCCLVFLAVISVCVSLAFGYYHFFVKEVTTGTNYIDNQIGLDIINSDDLTEEQKNEYEERWFMEANYYSNSKNNGIAVQELNFNYFTDYTLTSDKYRATGMQYMGDLKQSDLILTKTSENEAQKYQSSSFTYYDTTDGISYSGNKLNTQLNRESAFTIKIDNRAFQIQLTGSYEWSEWYGHWYTIGIPVEHKNILYYNYLNVFADCMEAIRSNSAGYGDYYIIVDLSEYFTICEFDTSTGKYKEDNVTDIIKNYSVLKFHYDENGLVNSDQSIFGQIECNSNYGVNHNIDTTYWQERMVYTLDENDFGYRYSEIYDGHFISLNMTTKKLFEDMPRAKVNVVIVLKSEYLLNNKINVVGIDYNGFENFEIDTLTILGNKQTFYMLDKALYNTNLQKLIYSNGITFEFAENSINNEYVEVVRE